jgi:hypothetical protein
MSLIIHAGASPGTRDDEAGAGENRLRERAEESRASWPRGKVGVTAATIRRKLRSRPRDSSVRGAGAPGGAGFRAFLRFDNRATGPRL